MTAALLERPGSRVYGDSDVVSVNIYPQWYHNTPVAESLAQKLKEIREHGGAGKPVIISEIGAGGIYGYQTRWANRSGRRSGSVQFCAIRWRRCLRTRRAAACSCGSSRIAA